MNNALMTTPPSHCKFLLTFLPFLWVSGTWCGQTEEICWLMCSRWGCAAVNTSRLVGSHYQCVCGWTEISSAAYFPLKKINFMSDGQIWHWSFSNRKRWVSYNIILCFACCSDRTTTVLCTHRMVYLVVVLHISKAVHKSIYKPTSKLTVGKY